MKKLTLSELWIYPIKSLAGIRLNACKVLPKGLQYDRRWMLVDEQGIFMTQRLFPKMALFKPNIVGSTIVISYNQYSLTLPLYPAPEKEEQVQVWDDMVYASEINREYSEWFSDLMGLRCRLVYFPENNLRPVDARYRVHEDDNTSLSDGYPFLIIGQRSLDDLNQRLHEPISIDRFRPNFVFTGGDPYEEDTWRNFMIGSNKFVGVKPSARCIVTTIDQKTSQRNAEPLKTLATYRKKDNKIYFGQNVIAVDHKQVSIGDHIVTN